MVRALKIAVLDHPSVIITLLFQEEEEEDFAQTEVRCLRAHPL